MARKNNNTTETKYTVAIGKNGKKYIPFSQKAIRADLLHLSTSGNTKTGPCAAFNLPVELTCDHRCDCYKSGKCYACGGFYLFGSNQVMYSENLKFFLTHASDEFIDAIVNAVITSGLRLFRWFTCGDIVNYRFFTCMIEVARRLPFITFWTYTKKYAIVNKWLDRNGGVSGLPVNFQSVIFSHWMNDNGTYYNMPNPYNMPTSEFIPFGREDLLDTVDHVCPCSDPDIFTTCATCPNPCYTLKPGMSMGLCEHSTPATRERDKYIKEAKKEALANGNVKLAAAIAHAAQLVKEACLKCNYLY